MSGDEIKLQSNALYEACLSQGVGRVFTQEDLNGLGLSLEAARLVVCINQLLSNGLFKYMTMGGRPCWKVLDRKDSAKYRDLTQEEQIVLQAIEDAGRDGIWKRHISQRTNLHSIPMDKCLKSLELKNVIKQTPNAQKRKLYILSDLQPNEKVSGGPFYGDGTLDEDFIEYTCRWLEEQIQVRSWVHVPGSSRKRRRSGSAPESRQDSRGSQRDRYLPQPPGYTKYPSLSELAKGFNDSRMATVKLKEAEVEQLLDLLRWDGKIVKAMAGKGYKAVRRPDSEESHSNEMTEVPCGRCPVFDLCDEIGPVNAKTCSYLSEWFEGR